MLEASAHCPQTYTKEDADTSFSAGRWLAYFLDNKQNRTVTQFSDDLSISQELREPLIRSLQRFQIGETGEGKHLKKFAKTKDDPTYEQCIDLFLKEEHAHARILAEMIAALDGSLLTWHWSDLVFIMLRRALGLKTEIFILLIAEIVGKCFYLQCARNLKNERLSDTFSVIVLDEIAHVEFHCDFLRTELITCPQPVRYAIYWAWATLFYAASLVFVLDHRLALAGLEVSQRKFLDDCSGTFHRAASRALAI